eukprot:scaffold378_cov270-Chaetoceros_neogracile.AAC.45
MDSKDCTNPNCACGGDCSCGDSCKCCKPKDATSEGGCDNSHCKCTKCGCGKGCVCNVPGIED